MKKTFAILAVITLGILSLTSCYNNKYDVLSLPKVSFVSEVVPIMTSGACGCHNSPGRAKGGWVQFTDTTTGKPNYDGILARAGTMEKWAKGEITHPAGGSVELTENDKKTILDWVAQGKVSDYTPPAVTGTITYAANIAPMVKSTCTSGGCHGGSAVALTYATLTTSSNISHLTQMANSAGASGHPGGSISLSSSVTKMILDWITQGTKQ